MASKILSIEVGYYTTKIVEMDFRTKSPKIYKTVTVETPEGVYEDGFINENAEFSALIKKALSDNKIKTKTVVASITSSKIANREVMLADVNSKQLAGLVETNASDYFPMDLAQYEVAHLALGPNKDADGTTKQKVMVMAMDKKLITDYMKLCDSCGLHLISLDYTGNSVYQLMKNEIKDETAMVIKVEEKNTLAAIISGSKLSMLRNVSYGFDNAVYTMMNSSAFPEKTFKEAFNEMKRVRCINLKINEDTELKETDAENEISEKVKLAMLEMTESLAPLVGNINRVIDLYNSKNAENPIKKLYLIGSGSDIEGFSKLFTNETGINTVICGNLRGVSFTHGLSETNAGKLVASIGAGLAPIGFINEEKQKNDLKDVNYKNVTILVAVFSVILLAFLYFSSYIQLMNAQAEKVSLENKISLYEPCESTYNKYTGIYEFYNQFMGSYNETKAPNDNLVNFLADLEKTLPSEAEVTSLTSDSESCVFSINVADLEVGAKLVQNIREFDCSQDVVVTSVSKEEIEKEVSEEELEGLNEEETGTKVKDPQITEGFVKVNEITGSVRTTVRVHVGPSLESEVPTSAETGKVATVKGYETNEGGTWYLINYDDVEGYVRSDFFILDGELSKYEEPVNEEGEETLEETEEADYYYVFGITVVYKSVNETSESVSEEALGE